MLIIIHVHAFHDEILNQTFKNLRFFVDLLAFLSLAIELIDDDAADQAVAVIRGVDLLLQTVYALILISLF